MAARRNYDDVQVGARLPDRETVVSRITLLLYGGQPMRTDFAGVHWSERMARAAGLPNVILHGPLLLEKALEFVGAWAGDPGCVEDLDLRFLRPVPVPDDETGAILHFSGDVAEKLADHRVSVVVQVTCPGTGLAARMASTVRLA
jgi:acyl dehydratase